MLIRVKVFPGSKKEEVVKTGERSFEVRVKAKPIHGEANRAARNILALYFRVPLSHLKLVKGFKEKSKIFEVRE